MEDRTAAQPATAATQPPTEPPTEDAAKQLRAAFERARSLHQAAAWEALDARELGHYERAARLAGYVEGLRLGADLFGVELPGDDV